MTKRRNKTHKHKYQQRNQARRVKHISRLRPEDREILKIEIPHPAYDVPILVIIDGKFQDYINLYRRGLHNSRGIPVFDEASQIPEENQFVQYYMYLGAPNSMSPTLTIEEAQAKAFNAYRGPGGPLEKLGQDALISTLLYYTQLELADGITAEDFVDETTDSEFMDMFDLPPNPVRDMTSRIEQGLELVRDLMQTDEDFNRDLTDAIQAATAKARAEGLLGRKAKVKEAVSDEGFQGSGVSGDLPDGDDAASKN